MPVVRTAHDATAVAACCCARASSVANARGSQTARLDRRPAARVRTSGDVDQRRTVAAMYRQAVRRTELMTGRVENVQVGGVLGVEAEHRRGRAEADRDHRAAGQVEAT